MEAVAAALLSVLLYLAIQMAFSNAHGRAVTSGLAFFMVWLASTELRSGVAYIRNASYRRSEKPGMYWCALLGKSLVPLALAVFLWRAEH
jgi:hypothetical protein